VTLFLPPTLASPAHTTANFLAWRPVCLDHVASDPQTPLQPAPSLLHARQTSLYRNPRVPGARTSLHRPTLIIRQNPPPTPSTPPTQSQLPSLRDCPPRRPRRLAPEVSSAHSTAHARRTLASCLAPRLEFARHAAQPSSPSPPCSLSQLRSVFHSRSFPLSPRRPTQSFRLVVRSLPVLHHNRSRHLFPPPRLICCPHCACSTSVLR